MISVVRIGPEVILSTVLAHCRQPESPPNPIRHDEVLRSIIPKFFPTIVTTAGVVIF